VGESKPDWEIWIDPAHIAPPEWRKALAERLNMTNSGVWPAVDTLVHG
jgi:hypothetical protein